MCAVHGGGNRCEFIVGAGSRQCRGIVIRAWRCAAHGQRRYKDRAGVRCKKGQCHHRAVVAGGSIPGMCIAHGGGVMCAFEFNGDRCTSFCVDGTLCRLHATRALCYVCSDSATHRSPLADFGDTDNDICESCWRWKAYLRR